MMKKTFAIFSVLAVCAGLSAQNINQSVQVTNDYESKFSDIQKKGVELSIPDSLYRFDYDFNYSVFENPYRGSYDFSPYRVSVVPYSSGYDGSKFYLRAGAGYSFHPLLTAVYNAVDKDDFTLSLYSDGGGYGGKYWNGVAAYGGTQQRYDGYSYNESIGVSGHKMWDAATLAFNVGYDGIYAAKYKALSSGNAYEGSGYHSGALHADLRSDASKATYFFYDVALDYRFGADALTQDRGTLGEHNFGVSGSVGPVIKSKFRMLIDFAFNMEHASISGSSSTMTLADIKPHFKFNAGPVVLDAGARLDYLSDGDGTNFTVTPVVRADLQLFDGKVDVFAGLDGGQKLLGFHDLKSMNSFYGITSVSPHSMNEQIDIFLGVGGNAGSRLQYELRGGYNSIIGAPLTSVDGFDFVTLRNIYADLALTWNSERLLVDGNVHFGKASLSGTQQGYLPSMFNGNLRAVYNWSKRIFAGLWVEGATARKYSDSSLTKIPGYVNLGIEGEYRMSSKLGFWLQGGNLIGMAIEKIPGVVEKGPYVTAGITLKFQ